MVAEKRPKAVILDADAVRRAWRRIAHEVVERQPELQSLVLIGIVTLGLPLAERLKTHLKELEGIDVPVIGLDVRSYRDDLPDGAAVPPSVPRELVRDRHLLLVDDVLFNGRTVRSAIDALMTAARPRSIQLAVLIDRGHRELPIRPDYVGKNLPTSRQEWVEVHVQEVDGEDSVRILELSSVA
jgi:pyrimidine operon attenuation protein/uracil phosphoribosyltransferase